jgi:hypothetical protein
MTPARIAAGLGAALALALAIAPSAGAAAPTSSDYVARSFTGTAASGLPVTGPLAPRRAVARVRVVIPARWRVLSAPAGRLRVITPGTSCRYRVTFTVSAALGAPGDAVARVDAGLPSPGPNRILDSGTHGSSAFRVTRPTSADQTVQLRGLRSGVLTRRTDIVPAGQVAWSDVRVSAGSRVGDECHSGTYRQVLGPQLGDALATARVRLDFTSPG